MENEAKSIFMGKTGSSTNIIIDQNKLATKLGLNIWFDDYYEGSKQVTLVFIIRKEGINCYGIVGGNDYGWRFMGNSRISGTGTDIRTEEFGYPGFFGSGCRQP